VKTRTPE